jgi:hypothetical protein
MRIIPGEMHGADSSVYPRKSQVIGHYAVLQMATITRCILFSIRTIQISSIFLQRTSSNLSLPPARSTDRHGEVEPACSPVHGHPLRSPHLPRRRTHRHHSPRTGSLSCCTARTGFCRRRRATSTCSASFNGAPVRASWTGRQCRHLQCQLQCSSRPCLKDRMSPQTCIWLTTQTSQCVGPSE